MLVEQITSRQNPLVKRAIRIREGAEPGHMFVEGVRLAEEALDAGVAVEAFIHTQALAASERGAQLLERARAFRFRGAVVPESLLKTICDTTTPQGVAILAAQPLFVIEDLFAGESPLVVGLDGLQDPGNVGTILRSAEAAGASGVATTVGTAEPYGAKAVRASMGSAFRLPVVRRAPLLELARAIRERGGRVVATTSTAPMAYTSFDWRGPALLLVGGEGAGLSAEARALADAEVSIPLAGPVESLNAAMAATVILFEAARQRH